MCLLNAVKAAANKSITKNGLTVVTSASATYELWFQQAIINLALEFNFYICFSIGFGSGRKFFKTRSSQILNVSGNPIGHFISLETNKTSLKMIQSFLKIIIPALFIIGCKNNTENKINDDSKSAVTANSSKDANKIYKKIHIMAKPDSIAIDTARTAVIVVDMENDFGSKGGMFDRAGIDISMIQKVINPTSNVLAAARKAGIKIIYLKMGYHDDLSDIGSEESPNRVRHLQFMHVGDTIIAPNGSKSRILIRDSWGTDIVPELKPQTNDIVMYKTRFSGFYKTELDSLLKQLGKKYLIITGCTTSICVESTVRDAMFRDYSSIVLEDCTAEPIGYGLPRSNHEASLLSIQTLLGWVSTSEEFIKAISWQPGNLTQKLQK